MNLKDRITEDMRAAMRARETSRLSTIRLLLAAIKQREVDERSALNDAAILGIVNKLVKQGQDSLSQFERAGRADLIAKQRTELDVLLSYLPYQLSENEIAAEVHAVIAQTGAAGPQDRGKVMRALKSRLAGVADMATVSAQVKAALIAK